MKSAERGLVSVLETIWHCQPCLRALISENDSEKCPSCNEDMKGIGWRESIIKGTHNRSHVIIELANQTPTERHGLTT